MIFWLHRASTVQNLEFLFVFMFCSCHQHWPMTRHRAVITSTISFHETSFCLLSTTPLCRCAVKILLLNTLTTITNQRWWYDEKRGERQKRKISTDENNFNKHFDSKSMSALMIRREERVERHIRKISTDENNENKRFDNKSKSALTSLRKKCLLCKIAESGALQQEMVIWREVLMFWK